MFPERPIRRLRPLETVRQRFLEQQRAEKRRQRVNAGLFGLLLLAVLVLPILCWAGCSSLLPAGSSAPSPTCRYYDDAFVGWQATAIASGSLSGAAGASGMLSSALGDAEGADIALGASGAVLGALAAVSAWVSSHYAEEFARECTRTGIVPP